MKPIISACLVIYNEEKNIKCCINSIKNYVDEIIVVHDGNCSDKSLEIAKTLGATIYLKDHYGVAEYHRPFAFSKANGDWILHIDGDEELKSLNDCSLKDLIKKYSDAGAFSFKWTFRNRDGVIIEDGPYSKWYRSCLFKKSQLYMVGVVHDHPQTRGKILKNDHFIINHHHDLPNIKIIKKKVMPWSFLRYKQLSQLSSIPLFNIMIGEVENKIKYNYRLTFLYGIKEIIKLLILDLKKGLLTSNLDNWNTALVLYYNLFLLYFGPLFRI